MKVTIESPTEHEVQEFKSGELYIYDQGNYKYVVLVTGNTTSGSNFSGTVVASESESATGPGYKAKPIGYTSVGFSRNAFKSSMVVS